MRRQRRLRIVTLGAAALTWVAGLTFALGGFLVGLLLADTACPHQVQLTIEPFRGLFFLAVGMASTCARQADQPVGKTQVQ